MFKERIKTHHSAMGEAKKYVKGPGKVTDLLSIENKGNDAVIYIHIPFCSKICTFCNMRRTLQKPTEVYADYVVKEIKQYAALPYVQTTVFDAVYFGGGTPTTLPVEDLVKIIRALKENFTFTKEAEFTVETTITELKDKYSRLIEEGITRFSVGVQTFNNNGRKIMGRIGSGEAAYELLKEIKQTNVTLSMDLIYNYPGQTIKDLKEDLDKIIALDLNGFSMYSLIDMKENRISHAQGQENDEAMFFEIATYMSRAGYHFLELTKMVKNDRYAYIMNRHKGADTLPLGAAAGGSMGGVMLMNEFELLKYQNTVDHFENRMGMGFLDSYKDIVCFKGDVQTAYLPKNISLYQDIRKYEEFVEQLLNHEMIVREGEYYKLTNKGVYWGNTISRELYQMTV